MTEPISAKEAIMSQEKEPRTPDPFTARALSPGFQGPASTKAHLSHSLNTAHSGNSSISRPAMGHTAQAECTGSNISNLKPVLQRVPESWMQEQQQQQQLLLLSTGRHVQAPPPSPRAPVATSPRAVGLPNTIQARSAVAIQRFAAALDAAGLADPLVRALAFNYTARTRSSSVQDDDCRDHRPVAVTPGYPAAGSNGGVNVAQITSSLLMAAGPAAGTAVARGSGTPGSSTPTAAAAAAGHSRGHTVPAGSFVKPVVQYRIGSNSAYMTSSSSPQYPAPLGHTVAAAAAAARDPSSSATAPSTPATPATAAVAVQKFAANASKAGLANAEFMAIAATASSPVKGANPAHKSSSSAAAAGTERPPESVLLTSSSAASSMVKASNSNQAMGYSAAGTVAPLLRTSDYGTYNNNGRKYGGSGDGSVGVCGRRSPSTRTSESCDGSVNTKLSATANTVSSTHAGSMWGHHRWHLAASTCAAAAGAEGHPAPAVLPPSNNCTADGDCSTGSRSGAAVVNGADRSASDSVAKVYTSDSKPFDGCGSSTTRSSSGGGGSIACSSRSRQGSHHAQAVPLDLRSTRSSNANSGTTFSSTSGGSSSSLRQFNIERAMLPECTDPQQQTQEEIQSEQSDYLADATTEPDPLGEPQFWLSPLVASAARTSGGCSQLLSHQSCQSLQGSADGNPASLHEALRNRKVSTLRSEDWASAPLSVGSDISSAAAAAALPTVQQMQPGAGHCEQQQQQESMEQRSIAGSAVAAAGAAAAAAIGGLRSLIGRQSGAGVPAAEAASLPMESPRDASEDSEHSLDTAAVEHSAEQHQLLQPEAALRQRITHSAASGNSAAMHWAPASPSVPGSPVLNTSEYASTLDQTGDYGYADQAAHEAVKHRSGINLSRMFLCGSAPDCGSKAATDDVAAKHNRASQPGSSMPRSKAVILLLTLLVLVATAGAGAGIYFGVRHQSKAVQAAAAAASNHFVAGTRAVAAGGVVGVSIAEGEGGIGNPASGAPAGVSTASSTATGTAVAAAAGAGTAAGAGAVAGVGGTTAGLAVPPMNFQVALAVPARSPAEACAVWFNGTERLSLYKQTFSAAYSNALHVLVHESSINSITCNGRSMYNSSYAASALGTAAAAAAAGATPGGTQQSITSTAAAAPGSTSAVSQADSLLVSNTPVAAAGGVPASVGTAGMRLAGQAANQTVHQIPHQDVNQEVKQEVVLTAAATAQSADFTEAYSSHADHQHLANHNHTMQLLADQPAPHLTTTQHLQQPATVPLSLAAGNATGKVQVAKDSVLATGMDSSDATGSNNTTASIIAAAAHPRVLAAATTVWTGTADTDRAAPVMTTSAPELETHDSSATPAQAAAVALGNTTAAAEAVPTEVVTAASSIPLYLAVTAADATTVTPTTVVDSTDANATAHMRSLLQRTSDSSAASLALVEVVTRFSMAAPATNEDRARIVDTVVTASSAILSEPLRKFFLGVPPMTNADGSSSSSSSQASAAHEIAPTEQLQQQVFGQKWIIPTVGYGSAPTCLFNLTKENSLQDEEGRLWSIMDGKQCVFRPNADIPRPEVKTYAWKTAPVCAGQATEATSVADDSGRLWGWQNGSSCAFRQIKQQQAAQTPTSAAAATQAPQAAGKQDRPVKLSLVWNAAPPCSFAPTKANAVPDTYGRLWSWEHNRSCAFKWQSLPDSPQLPI